VTATLENPPQERRFGRFVLRAELGAGAMGTVHRAYDPESGSECALKVLALPLAAFPEAERRELLRRFEREARLASAVEHPGIARVRDAGESDGVPWIAMDLVAGETLAALVKRRRHDPAFRRSAVEVVAEAAEALHAAHEKGVVHRDVKPANVLVESATGRARVTDFGLAREVAPGSRLTQDGQVIGTPQYMAPEQARGDLDAIDAQTDVYGLGATLYEALTGRPPFQGDVAWKVALEVIRSVPETPRAVDQSIPAPLEAIVLCAMAPRKDARYTSAQELAQELRNWLTQDGSVRGRPRAPRGPTLGYLVRLVMRQHKTTACAVGIAAALMVAGTAFFLWRLSVLRERAERRAEVARATLEVMIYEVKDQLEDLPGERARSVRRRLLESAISGIEDLRDAVARDAPTSLAAAEAQRQVGDLALAAGLTERAELDFKRALLISRRAAEEDPTAIEPRLDTALSLARVGRGRRAAGASIVALLAYKEAEALLRTLRADAAAGRAVSGATGIYSYWSSFVTEASAGGASADEAILGALVEIKGEYGATSLEVGDPAALEICREAVALAREAVARSPAGRPARTQLAWALVRLAGAYGGGERGGLEEAEEAVRLARDALVLPGRVAGPARPEDALTESRGRIHDLLHALLCLSATRRTGGDPSGALEAAGEALAQARGTFGADGASVRARRDLAEALLALGLAHEAAGDAASALASVQEAQGVLDALSTQDAGNTDARRMLGRALTLEGEARLHRGEAKEARASLERALAIAEAFAAADPESAAARRDRASALAALARAHDAAGDTEAAERCLADAVHATSLRTGSPEWQNADFQRWSEELEAVRRTGLLLAGEVAPEGPLDQLLLAESFARRRDWTRAAERYHLALQEDETRATTRDALFRGACAAAHAARRTAGKEAQGWRDRALRWLALDVRARVADAPARGPRALAAYRARIAAEPAFAEVRASSEFQAAVRPLG